MKKITKTSVILEVDSILDELEINSIIEKALQEAGLTVINLD